jgi:hypothetical protein
MDVIIIENFRVAMGMAYFRARINMSKLSENIQDRPSHSGASSIGDPEKQLASH